MKCCFRKVYIINFLHKSARKDLKANGLDCKMLKLSELEKRPLHEFGYAQNRGGNTGGSQKSSKHSTKEFVLNKDKLKHRRWNDAKSAIWDTAQIDIDNDSGIYVGEKLADRDQWNPNTKNIQKFNYIKIFFNSYSEMRKFSNETKKNISVVHNPSNQVLRR